MEPAAGMGEQEEQEEQGEQEGGRSSVWAGARALGVVSTELPLAARYIKRRGEALLATSAGRRFHTYSAGTGRLLSVSGRHARALSALAADTYHVYTAAGGELLAWRRGTERAHSYRAHAAPVRLLLPFGPHLVSIDEAGALKVWDIKEETLFLELQFQPDTFRITTMMHPPTYLNKILLGSEQGELQLWNLRTAKLIFTFVGWGSAVRVVEPAPAVDVVAIALANGKIILHNLKYNVRVMEFAHDWGAVSCISFRLDGVPVMVTGSSEGHIVMWDLEERRVLSQIESAHKGAVAGLQCMMSEPLMVTNSGDNSLKLWIFDIPDGGARLLRKREGHSTPPNLVRHCEPLGENLLSAGSDSSLHIMNTVTETFNKSMGRASYSRKTSKKKKRLDVDNLIMPPIVNLSSCMQRDKQWDSIATIHQDMYMATTWSYNKIRMGDHKLKPPQFEKGVQATCLTVTHCGNFVLLGYSNGQVHKFNMQSGLHRGHYGRENRLAHKGSVRGVETDIYNQRVISVGADDRLKFWHFKSTTSPFCVLKLEESVSMTKCHRESGLLALCNEDFSITLVDMDMANVVRKFDGHQGRINDVTFDAQSRWLISTSMDCTVCTWDIPSGHLVDIFTVDQPCTSLSMSPTGDYLATTHVGEVGVFLWANLMLYNKVYLKPIMDRSVDSVPRLKLPSTISEKPSIDDLGTLDLNDEEYISPEQISKDLITLSSQPTSRWLNLLNLDIVKRRNKPKTALTVPKSAPFFLPTIPGLQSGFDIDDKNNGKDTKLLIPESFTTLTPIGKALNSCKNDGDFKKCVEKIVCLSPAAIDIEVTNLAPDAGGSIEVMNQFLQMIDHMLRSNKDFELAQSYLGLFLKLHTTVVSESSELRDVLDEIEKSESAAWAKLQNLLFYNICVVKALKDM